jgi:hypothetical protein
MVVRSILCLSAIVLCFAISEKEKPSVEIPLDDIWALDMPGTKDIRDLENRAMFRGMKVADIVKNSLVENTRSVLDSRHRPPRGQSAGPGFVVAGIGLDALKEANAVLAKKKERPKTLPAGEELTLVFFSYSSGRRVKLDNVFVGERAIRVEYHLEFDGLRMSTMHFALVPIGVFKPGIVNVQFTRLPDTSVFGTTKPLDEERVRQLVCESFTFQVSRGE